jgi:hypothetical protein
MKNVLLIAGLSEDYYYSPFIDACKNKNLKIFIFDPSQFPEKANIGVFMRNGGESRWIY